MPDNRPAELAPPTEIYSVVRGQIDHYDNAINQRVIWLTIGQSFFFGVYATLVSIKAPSPDLLEKQNLLSTLLPFAALLAAVFTIFDVIAGLIYLRKIRLYYDNAVKNNTTDDMYPPVNGTRGDRIFQHVSPTLVPLVFILTWAIILLCTYHVV